MGRGHSKFILFFIGGGERWPKVPSEAPERRWGEVYGGPALPSLSLWGPKLGKAMFPEIFWNVTCKFVGYILVLFGIVCLGQQCQAKILDGRRYTLAPLFLFGRAIAAPSSSDRHHCMRSVWDQFLIQKFFLKTLKNIFASVHLRQTVIHSHKQACTDSGLNRRFKNTTIHTVGVQVSSCKMIYRRWLAIGL